MAKRRDVIVAEVFYTDTPQSKIRPCIVLSNEGYDAGFLLVAPITNAKEPHCILIGKSDASCELTSTSSARGDEVLRISKDAKMRAIGQVTPAFYNRVVGHLTGLIR